MERYRFPKAAHFKFKTRLVCQSEKHTCEKTIHTTSLRSRWGFLVWHHTMWWRYRTSSETSQRLGTKCEILLGRWDHGINRLEQEDRIVHVNTVTVKQLQAHETPTTNPHPIPPPHLTSPHTKRGGCHLPFRHSSSERDAGRVGTAWRAWISPLL